MNSPKKYIIPTIIKELFVFSSTELSLKHSKASTTKGSRRRRRRPARRAFRVSVGTTNVRRNYGVYVNDIDVGLNNSAAKTAADWKVGIHPIPEDQVTHAGLAETWISETKQARISQADAKRDSDMCRRDQWSASEINITAIRN